MRPSDGSISGTEKGERGAKLATDPINAKCGGIPQTFPSAKTNDVECARNISSKNILSSCWWHSSQAHLTNFRCTTPRHKPTRRSTTLTDRVDRNDFPRDVLLSPLCRYLVEVGPFISFKRGAVHHLFRPFFSWLPWYVPINNSSISFSAVLHKDNKDPGRRNVFSTGTRWTSS